jgi:HupH hydrogenase expression protein, C-terminal conserved region.
VLKDNLEVGIIPTLLLQSTFSQAASQIDTHWTSLPDGVMNAPPVLAELNAKIANYQTGMEPHCINLSLLPQTEQDLAFLESTPRLGCGYNFIAGLW